MDNKFDIGDVVYFTSENKVRKERIQWIREQRYVGVDLKPSYCYSTTNVAYLDEDQLHSTLESILLT